MTATDNLWPEFSLDEVIRSPKTVLNEQAEFLANGTKNLLTANVNSYNNDFNEIAHDFIIIAPNLNGYRYKLFTLTHDSIMVYPCEIYEHNYGGTLEIDNESQLLAALKVIFSNETTKKVIKSLISQSIENLPF